MKFYQEPIIALATAAGNGAIAVIRLSGENVIQMVSEVFDSASRRKLIEVDSHTVHLGQLMKDGNILDEVLVTIFKNPRSYTGEDVVEISCHGSHYIQQEIIQLFLNKGCRMATAGEFTLRAFLNGKMDLSQAEAVADLIASDNAAAHQLAIQQMRGGFSNELSKLREQLLHFASLIELELDFAEEDVDFADREEFKSLLTRIVDVLKRLIDSFATGNVLKKGIPVAIIGEPNVGKSTLLNALLNEQKAIVSDIAGTTRDSIEDEIAISWIGFRFIDTAGIRETQDTVESIGIKRTFEKINQSKVALHLVDARALLSTAEGEMKAEKLRLQLAKTKEILSNHPHTNLVLVVNKTDEISDASLQLLQDSLAGETEFKTLLISAKTGLGIPSLKTELVNFVNTGALRNDETIISNARHFDALQKALSEIRNVQQGLRDDLSGDLLAIDIRQALYHFGEITGEISNDELLGNIFANFCIGK